MNDRDALYTQQDSGDSPFRFDARVAAVFRDMIERSVPGYALTLDLLSTIAGRCSTASPRCYDLGCSLGAATLAMLRGSMDPGLRVIAVDNSSAMVERAETAFSAAGVSDRVELRCEDIRTTALENASLVVMNFTLQFVPLAERSVLLRRIAMALQPEGQLVLSEKLQFDDTRDDVLLRELHHEFKRQQGYSELEIARKRSALENVLIPETLEAHRERLLGAGFSQVTVWLQCFNFVSLLATR